MSTPDYSGFEEEASGTDLELLSGLGLQLRELDRQKAEAQAKVKKIEAEMRQISWQQIPELMEKLGMKSFELNDGSTIKVREEMRASFPKDPEKREAALIWLEEHGAEHLVKRAFEITFDKGDEKWADKFERDCKQRKKPLNIDRTKTIATASLKKFITDKLAAGEDVPLDKLGAHRQTIAEFKEKK